MRHLMMVSVCGLTVFGLAAMTSRAAPDTSLPAAAVASAPAPPRPTNQAPAFAPEPAWSVRHSRPPAVAPTGPTQTTTDTGPPVQVSSEAKWDLAGYNNDEVIYTIFITSHDPRIIRCITKLDGFFYDHGEKQTVSDRQSTTVFPEQRVQAGNWQGMDKRSPVTYSVKCHPV
jgi:hypothetical protein